MHTKTYLHPSQRIPIALTLVTLLLGGLWISNNPRLLTTPALAAGDHAPGLRVIEADEQGIVLELTVGEPVIETVLEGGETFQRLTLPDLEMTDTPGAPQLPLRSTLLGVPTTAGLVLTVLATEPETRSNLRVYPAPQLTLPANNADEQPGVAIAEIFAFDAARYNTAAFVPGPLVELGETGYMRDQAVARVTFYPVQYHPVRRAIQFYQRIRVRLTWPTALQAAATGTRGTSAAYEALLGTTLLNYATLGRTVLAKRAPVGAPGNRNRPSIQPEIYNAELQLKIGVSSDGLYKLSFDDLTQTDFNTRTLDPRRWQVTQRGQPIPIYIQGEEDGRFDPGDFVLFYGAAIQDDIYTTTNVYWLAANSSDPKRMDVRDGVPSGVLPTPDRFPTTLHAEQDTVYWSNMLNAQPAEDRWFWERRIALNTLGFPDARVYTVALPGLAQVAGETASLRVRVKGYTATNHQIQVALNGNPVSGPQTWSGQTEYTYLATAPAAWLKAGDNQVEVKLLPSAAGANNVVDAILVNWLEIDSGRSYAAVDDKLRFTTPLTGRQNFQLSGFTGATVTVLDITAAEAPVRIRTTSGPADPGQWRVHFQDEAAPAKQYLAVGEKGYQPPAYLLLDEPANLRTVEPGLNYIIITHPEFYTSTQELADHRRQSSGFVVKTVKIADIYDEFNFGIANPQAIRAYLAHVYTATTPPPPDYVLLFGDATVDYRGNLTPPTRNFVPTQIVSSTLFGEVPSDNWFVTVSGNDILPEMSIGRLVAQNAEEAQRMVARIIDYDKVPPSAPWNKRVLLVADDDESKFADNSDELAADLPLYGYTVNKVYARDYPPPAVAEPRTQIINLINQGAILVNYFGHGTYFGWGITPGDIDNPAEYIFHNQYVNALNNQPMLPVITIANCLNGAFAGTADRPALAELLQRSPTGGAIAVWAPSSLGYPSGHKELLSRFYAAVFLEDKTRLGDAATAAKIGAYNRSQRWAELVRTYVLFGDPATALGIPINAPYLVRIDPAPGSTAVAIDQDIVLSFSKPMSPTSLTLTTLEGRSFGPAESRGDRTFIFANPGLAYATSYTLTLRGQDLAGNPLITGTLLNLWSFTTVPDSRPRATLALVSATPGIAQPADLLQITFSEPVLPSSVEYVITPGVLGQFAWNTDGKQAIFEHENFKAGQIYTFTLRNAKDVTNNTLAEPVQLTFGVVKEWVYLPQIIK